MLSIKSFSIFFYLVYYICTYHHKKACFINRMRDKKVIHLHYANNLKLFALCMLCCLIIHSIFKKKEKTKMVKKMYFFVFI